MAVDQDLLDHIAGTVADLYREVEAALVRTVAQRLRKDLPSPMQEEKLDAVRQLQDTAQRILAKLQAVRAGKIREAVAQAYRSGSDAAVVDLPESWDPTVGPAARRAVAVIPNARIIENIAQALHRDVGRVDANILRAPVDAYRAVQAGAAARIASGAYTRREASQAAWQRLMDKGIVDFTDRANRRWKLSSYVEMMARTNIQRAATQGQTDRLAELGIDLVYVSDNVQECKRCRPFEGKVLRRDAGPVGMLEVEHATKDGEQVTVNVVDTLTGARARGLFHPNAILGNQECRVLGEIENAARAWYEGPSVHLTTARGNHLTVSPNHPVLTTHGWLAADRIREGMHVFSATTAEREGLPTDSVVDLHDVPTRFEQVFDAVAAHGRRTSITATGDDFHGDGRSYKGEVDVVWTERALLDVLQALGVQELGEGGLVGASMELHALTGGRAHLTCGHAVGGPVARPLPDVDTAFVEAAQQRPLADAEDLGELLAGLSCDVTPDQVVHVDRDWYTGHAYDLQTSTGAYLTADIVVHNCRHSVSAYLPGVTKPKTGTADPDGDKARQKQRALERRIRAAKEAEVGALTPEAKKDANAKVRAAQASLRDHLKANPKLKRLPYREQIGAGNIPRGEAPGGPIGDLTPPTTPPTPAVPDPGQQEAARQRAERERLEREQAERERAERERLEQAKREAAEAARRAAHEAEQARQRAAAPGMRAGLRHNNDDGLAYARTRMPLPDTLTGDERAALHRYTDDSDPINAAARGGERTPEVDKQINLIDSAMRKGRLKDPIVVHRGDSKDLARFLGADVDTPATMEALVGKVFVEKGFLSTSIGDSAALPGRIYRVYRIPKGYEALNVMPLSEYGEGEREILVRRGSHAVIHAVYRRGEAWIVEMEIVPDGWTPPAGWTPTPYGDAGDGYTTSGMLK